MSSLAQDTCRRIWPQVWSGNDLSIPVATLVWIWRKWEQDGRAEQVFYDGGVFDEQGWLRYVCRPEVQLALVVHPEHGIEFAGWLTDFRHGTAASHFCAVGDFHGLGAPRALLRYWDGWTDEQGGPLLRILLGVTPATHESAIRLSHAVGFKEVGRIPEFLHLAYENRWVDGVISYRRNGDGRRQRR